MKVWILGAGGQLGRALIDQSQLEKVPFQAFGRSDLDITDLEKLQKSVDGSNCTHLINCAAYTDVDGAEKNAKAAYEVNARGAENIGIVGRENGIKVVHVSTDYVFDGESETPYKETDKTSPINVYGKSKREGELRLLDELNTACIVRTSWIFGHGGKNFISSILEQLQNRLHLHAIDDQMNRATYNRDLARALLDLSFHTGIFHFANGVPMSRYEIVQDFYEEAKLRKVPLKCQKISPVSSDFFPSGSPRPKFSALDTQKASLKLGRKPRMWKTILREYFDHVSSLR